MEKIFEKSKRVRPVEQWSCFSTLFTVLLGIIEDDTSSTLFDM